MGVPDTGNFYVAMDDGAEWCAILPEFILHRRSVCSPSSCAHMCLVFFEDGGIVLSQKNDEQRESSDE